MRTILLLVCMLFANSSLFAQDSQSQESDKNKATISGTVLKSDDDHDVKIFDKKFIALSSVVVGSGIVNIELAHHRDPKNLMYRNNYIAQGMADFFVITSAATLRFYDKKWWWVPPIALAAVNGSITFKFVF